MQCGSIVVKALCCKPEVRGFETRGDELILSIYRIIPATPGPVVYQKHINNVSGEYSETGA
jgi:hypothetical protein